MTRFEDGPAAGQVLSLERAPVFLRVVEGPDGFDALDQLSDSPRQNELIFVYHRDGEAGRCHILRRGKGQRSGWYAIAKYRFHAEQPPDATMRSTEAWRGWCEEQQP